MKDEPKGKVDPQTGLVVNQPVSSKIIIPDMKTVTPINKVAGKNPMAINLRDHPELSGMEFLAVNAKFGSGDIGGKNTSFVVAGGFVYPPGQKPAEANMVVLITGADNVYSRLAEAFLNGTFPANGTLRKSGRAWFWD